MQPTFGIFAFLTLMCAHAARVGADQQALAGAHATATALGPHNHKGAKHRTTAHNSRTTPSIPKCRMVLASKLLTARSLCWQSSRQLSPMGYSPRVVKTLRPEWLQWGRQQSSDSGKQVLLPHFWPTATGEARRLRDKSAAGCSLGRMGRECRGWRASHSFGFLVE